MITATDAHNPSNSHSNNGTITSTKRTFLQMLEEESDDECSVSCEEYDNRRKKKKRDNLHLVLVLLCSTMFTLGGAFMLSSLFQSMEELIRKSEAAKKQMLNQDRKYWSYYNERLSDTMFYRLFRMNRRCFSKLCHLIEVAVGEDQFNSEAYMNRLRELGHTTQMSSIFNCCQHSSSGWVEGELKVAMTLRYLAGATYLDLFLAFHISANHILSIVSEVKREWFYHDSVLAIDYYKDVLEDGLRSAKISEEFSEGSRGILTGCIGAIDGWLCKIVCPSKNEVKNPGKYMSRKGFFAINVQVICDKKRRILWSCIGAKGSSHDSTVFKNSSLYKYLMRKADFLHERGMYLVGDSAYVIRGFILCPYYNAKLGSKEDNFNFFQSSQRIHIECTFGEINRRFGVFWKPLEGALSQHRYTMELCFRLHNLIVNDREERKKRGEQGNDQHFIEEDELNHHYNAFVENNPFQDMDVVEQC